MNTILTITGSDSAGRTGVQADIKTMSGLGAVALSVVTTITMQNTLGIQNFYDIPAEIVERQIEAVADDMMPCVFKIGLIRNVYMLEAIIRTVKRYRPRWVLFSPVVHSSHGDVLIDDDLLDKIRCKLIPLCHLLVVRKRDSKLLYSDNMVVADDSHGRCNELCSTIAVLLSQGMSLDEAERKAKYMLPARMNEDMSGRCLSLYREFMELIEAECGKSHDVNYFASRLNVSARYMSQITRKVASQSPKAIIDMTLLGSIKSLLATEMTVQEIAYKLGFSTQAHLSNFFKSFMGMPPTEYRKSLRL
jgi:hydroxymethylpyrimidine/phosphomethylpyrimidine kinase